LRTHRTSVRVATDMRPKPQQPGESHPPTTAETIPCGYPRPRQPAASPHHAPRRRFHTDPPTSRAARAGAGHATGTGWCGDATTVRQTGGDDLLTDLPALAAASGLPSGRR